MKDERFIRLATWPTERGTYLLVRKIPLDPTIPRFELWGPRPASQVWLIDTARRSHDETEVSNASPQGRTLLRRVGLLAGTSHVETTLDRRVLASAVREVLNAMLLPQKNYNFGLGCAPWPFRPENRIQEHLNDEKVLRQIQKTFRETLWIKGLQDRLDAICMVLFNGIGTVQSTVQSELYRQSYQLNISTRRYHQLRMTLMSPFNSQTMSAYLRWKIEMVLERDDGTRSSEVLAEHEEDLVSTLLRLNLLAEDTPAGQEAYWERMIGDVPEPVWLDGLREALETPRLLGTDPLTQTSDEDFIAWMHALGKLPEAWISIESFEA